MFRTLTHDDTPAKSMAQPYSLSSAGSSDHFIRDGAFKTKILRPAALNGLASGVVIDQLPTGVRCKKCRSPILFALDRTQGDGRFVPAGELVLTCVLSRNAVTGLITAGLKRHDFRRAEAGAVSGGSRESQGRSPQYCT